MRFKQKIKDPSFRGVRHHNVAISSFKLFFPNLRPDKTKLDPLSRCSSRSIAPSKPNGVDHESHRTGVKYHLGKSGAYGYGYNLKSKTHPNLQHLTHNPKLPAHASKMRGRTLLNKHKCEHTSLQLENQIDYPSNTFIIPKCDFVVTADYPSNTKLIIPY